MTEQEQQTVELLNELYAAQSRALLPRLAEAQVFVSDGGVQELEQIRRMVGEQAEHQAWLAEAIERAGGAVQPAWADPATGHLHYLALPTLLPVVLADAQRLSRLYAEAADRQPRLLPEAAAVIARIARRQREHLEQLGQIQQRMTSEPV